MPVLAPMCAMPESSEGDRATPIGSGGGAQENKSPDKRRRDVISNSSSPGGKKHIPATLSADSSAVLSQVSEPRCSPQNDDLRLSPEELHTLGDLNR